MRAYVLTTAFLFAAVAVLHLWRLVLEGWHVVVDSPIFAVSTLISVAMTVWAWRLLKR